MDCFNNEKIYKEDDLLELNLLNSSKGNQHKWYDSETNVYVKGQFMYQNKAWKDYLVEILAHKLAKQMNLSTAVLEQTKCKIITKDATILGVISKDFSVDEIEYISFYRLSATALNNQFPKNATNTTIFNYIRDIIYDICKFDCHNYVLDMLLLDTLLCNEDRHLHNFGVFRQGTVFKPAVLFDFGLGMFEHDRKYENIVSVEQVFDMVSCKPFQSNPIANINWLKLNQSEYLSKTLPKALSVENADFPNRLAREYFSYVCSKLGVEVRYV